MTALAPEGRYLLTGDPAHDVRMLEQIVENIPHMVFVKDAADLRFVRINRAAEELLGYGRTELLGLRDHDFLPVAEADFFVSVDRRVLAEGNMVEIDAEFVQTRYRGRRVLHTKKIPIYGEDGKPLYLLGISEDITERYEREQLLVEAREEAQRIEHERGATTKLLRGVIARHDLDILFQPIADLRTDSIVGAEALARFGLEPSYPPDYWFGRAAEVGLQVELEIAALECALARVDELSPELFVSVNLSPATLVSDELTDLLDHHSAGRLMLELTEHSRIDDYSQVEGRIEHLRGRGARVAVDDAGAGWSSMQHIVRIRPDMIKLDIDLTRGINANPTRRALAAALVAFAAEIGSTVVAEGIETLAELETVRDLGVGFGQGYLLGRPQHPPLPDVLATAR